MNDKLNEMLSGVKPAVAKAKAEENDDGLNEIKGFPFLPEYKAYSRTRERPVMCVHFGQPGGEVRTFQYCDLRSRAEPGDKPADFDAGVLRVPFMGMHAMTVVIQGRNLWDLYDTLHQHRIQWVMELSEDQDFDRNKGTPVVTRISFEPMKED